MNNSRGTKAVREMMLPGVETVQGVQEGFMLAAEKSRDLNIQLIDMAQANIEAACDFAREVAEAKGPSDLVQAWTTNTTKQFDLLTKQASELTRLGQRFAVPMPELKGR